MRSLDQRLRTHLTAALLLALAAPAAAIVPAQGDSPLSSLAFISDRVQAKAVLAPVEEVEGALTASVRDGWTGFRGTNGLWTAVIDKRSGTLEIAEGEGIPFLPGIGNDLTNGAIAAHLGTKAKVDLAVVESITRAFLPRVAGLLGVDPATLVLNPGRSGHPADHLWFVDFDVVRGGLPIEGARVVFRIGHGNLIQLGAENLPAAGVAIPAAKISRGQALANLSAYIGGFSAADQFVDGGSLRLVPVRIEDGRFNEGFEIGRGRGATPVWQFIFRRGKGHETWRARVDAVSGEMLELLDTNDYAQATGGVKFLGVASNQPMPFADLSTGGFTNSAGIFTHGGGAVSSTLNGQYVKISDGCGSISMSGDPDGNIAFGTSAGIDCSTPGVGGAGNTHSARTQFYHVNRVKEVARGWLPGNVWLGQQLTANVNINLTCNAFWSSASGTINFYRSGGGCGNTGEIEAVSLHEYGHGQDSNDGNGGSPDRGTGETYGDWTAALATHSSCIGSGFRATNCAGYGDACTSCTGVRDIDWGKRVSNTAHTVDNYTRPSCPTSATYQGPCLKEGHCESYVSSEALWDFVNRDLPSPGSGTAWTTAERLWYLSRSTATAAFACTTGATYTSNGCNTGSYWKTMRAVDDDDGNLANGTPNSAALYAAFNRHLIACTTDTGADTSFRGCTQPATPTVVLTPGDNEVNISWSGSTGVYDVYRNEIGCNAGFTRIANDLAASPLIDGNVANGFTYYYQVTAQPAGNESCASAPSTCQSVTPVPATCTPPDAPANFTATGTANQINLAWDAVSGATSYRVYRSATPGGPYSLLAITAGTTYAHTGLDCSETHSYVVRAATSAACQSVNSTEQTASTTACPPCATQTLYSNGFETGSGLADWTTGTLLSGGPTADWRGIQTCTAKTGTNIFRFGATTCTGDYANTQYNYAQPNGAGGINIPAGSRTSRLSFWHRRGYENGFDGGALAVSLNGTSYTIVPSSAILSGSYNGTLSSGTGGCTPAGVGGTPAFTGVSSTFTETVVNLDAACNAASGGTGGCGGQAVRIGFTSATDCSLVDDGWFLDDVAVTSCVPTVPATPADYYTLTPCRLFDTRLADGPLGGPVLQPATERSFTVTGVCGVPSTAKSLLLNVTVVSPASAGYVQAYPGDGSVPATSTITFALNQLISNNAVVNLAGNGSGTIKVRPGTTGTVHVVADVLGYFE
ncbi:MAG TPA: hypothetical protein DD490_14605 [Acidobacteria bacterium]|nr:hypothetical protein [Acidobacteriota bacterium]